jgi:hypothetical protein
MKTAIFGENHVSSAPSNLLRLLIVLLLTGQMQASVAAVYNSRASGAWSQLSCWSTVGCGDATPAETYPKSGDTVFICSGHTITLDVDAFCAELNIAGMLQLSNKNITVSGTTETSGRITDNSISGTNTFNNIIIASGGTLDNSINSAFIINGSLSNSGTLTAGSGFFTFSGSSKTLAGSIAIPRMVVNGTYQNNGTLTVNNALTGSGTLTMGTNAVLYLGGTVTLSNLIATANPNTVIYTGIAGSQAVYGTTYFQLVIDNDGQVATLSGNASVNDDMTISSGTFQFGNAASYSLTVSGNFRVGSGALFQYTANSNRQHHVYISGNLINYGNVNIMRDRDDFVAISFRGAGNSLISGNGTWTSLAYMTMNKSSKTDTLHILSPGFGAALTAGAAILTKPFSTAGKNPPVIFSSGTFRYDIPDALGNLINPNAAGSPSFTINSQVAVIIEQGTVDMAYFPGVGNKADCILQGALVLNGGLLTISKNSDDGNNNGLYYEGSASVAPVFIMTGGRIECYGAFTSLNSGLDDLVFDMSAGTITTNMGKKAANAESFCVTDRSGSSVTFTGGTIIIQRRSSYSSSWNNCDFDMGGQNSGSFHAVTGNATVQFGNSLTPSNMTMRFKAYPNAEYPHFVIANPGGGKEITLQPYNNADWKIRSLTIETNQVFNVMDVQSGSEDHVMTLTGDNGVCSFCNNGTFERGQSTVRFGGDSLQYLCGTTVTMFRNLDFQNACRLRVNADIFSDLTLNAVVDLNNYKLTLGNSPGTNGTLHYASGYFYNGTFTRWFRNAALPDGNDERGLYPMGTTSGHYRPFWVSYPSMITSGGSISVAHFDSETTEAVHIVDGPALVLRRHNSRWALSTTMFPGVSNAPFSLRAGGTGYAVSDIHDLRLVRENDVVGTAGMNLGSTDFPIVSRTGISVANLNSDFFIGSINNHSSPLPVSLLCFSATTDNKVVNLQWETTTEVRNDHFIVERSSDAMLFAEMDRVEGAGYSNHLIRYNWVDQNPLTGVSYYRLKQVDFDGRITYSKIINIEVKKYISFKLYPNPSDGSIIYLSFSEELDCENLHISVESMGGRNVWVAGKSPGSNAFSNHILLLKPGNKLMPGSYIVSLTCGNDVFRQKLIVR